MNNRAAKTVSCAAIFLFLLLEVPYCGNSGKEVDTIQDGYDLIRPDQTIILPVILHEISGLTEIDSSTFACIQDEDGILFIYDIINKVIDKQFEFSGPGDYEGVSRAGGIFYVLRSDGVLFEISDYQHGKPQVVIYPTAIPAQDNEGLCYDGKNNRLLIACKSKIDKTIMAKNKRAIYGFDLKSKKLTSRPVIELDLTEIEQFVINNGIDLPLKIKKKAGRDESSLQLKISDLGINPLNGKLFVLSAAEYLLYIFDPGGKIEHIAKLDPLLFNKPEGITFFENGDLLISNEGQQGKPTVLRFNHK